MIIFTYTASVRPLRVRNTYRGTEGGRKGGRAAGREGGREEEGTNREREGERECVSEHEFGGEHRKSVYTLHMCIYI